MPAVLLTPTEKDIHHHLLAAVAETIPALTEPLHTAAIIRKESTPFYSLLYLEPKPLPPILPDLPRVPLELRFFGPWGAPIQCLLHVLDGTLHMIEIFCADSGPLPEQPLIDHTQIINHTKEIQ